MAARFCTPNGLIEVEAHSSTLFVDASQTRVIFKHSRLGERFVSVDQVLITEHLPPFPTHTLSFGQGVAFL